MAASDIPALTRGISGLFTANAEGKRFAEEDAAEQRSKALADRIRLMNANEVADRGRARRQEAVDKAAARKLQEEQLEEQQRGRLTFILSQLTPENRNSIGGFDSQALPDQIKTVETRLRRQRTTTDRVPRAPSRATAPKPFAQSSRVATVVREFKKSVDEGLNPEDDLLARMRAGNIDTPVPVDSASVRQQAMLQAVQGNKHLFTEDELPELTSILEGLVGEGQADNEEMSDDKVRQMIFDLNAQGLSRKEIQEELARRGISIELQ